jgi:hypothetical protein
MNTAVPGNGVLSFRCFVTFWALNSTKPAPASIVRVPSFAATNLRMVFKPSPREPEVDEIPNRVAFSIRRIVAVTSVFYKSPQRRRDSNAEIKNTNTDALLRRIKLANHPSSLRGARMFGEVLNEFEERHSHRVFQTFLERLHALQKIKEMIDEARLKRRYMNDIHSVSPRLAWAKSVDTDRLIQSRIEQLIVNGSLLWGSDESVDI